MLILLGDGVVANVLLKRSKAEGAGWMVITTGWAFAVLCGIFTAVAFGSADAHINPAVTLAFGHHLRQLTRKSFPTGVRNFWARSAARRWCGCTSCRTGRSPKTVTRSSAVFCTAPAIRHYPGNLFCEVIGTMLLIVVVAAIGSKAAGSDRTDYGLRPVLRFHAGVGDWVVAGRNDRATPSIPRAISVRAWRMRCGRWQGRELPTGPTRRSRYWGRCWALHWRR